LTGNSGAAQQSHPPAPPDAHDSAERSRLTALIREHSQMLMHLYAQMVPWAAAEFHGAVKAEDVRALMTSAYINLCKGGPLR
jgi:hypothetical protein